MFATALLRGLGGAGTVEALATATDPDSPYSMDVSEGSQWLEDFTAAGRAEYDYDWDRDTNVRVHGYQLLAPVLENGEYSTEFLTHVGADMIEFEQENPGVFDHAALPATAVVPGLDDNASIRFDPLDSLMTPMAGNAEASREFFDPEAWAPSWRDNYRRSTKRSPGSRRRRCLQRWIGAGVDGAVARDWTSTLGYSEETSFLDGYLFLPCTEGQPAKDVLIYRDSGSAGGPGDREPGYRQLAAVFVVAANALREHWGCEGARLPSPEGLDDEPPPVTPVADHDEVCGTFAGAQLDGVLGELDEPELSYQDAAPESWNAWHTPGDDLPVTGCEIWRPPLVEDEVEGAQQYTFGPMLAFQRLAGHVGAAFDPDWFENNHDRVTEWEVDLDGQHALIGSRDHREDEDDVRNYAADYFMLQRDCDGEHVTYTGTAYADTIPLEDYEPLLEEWIRAQAERDGCPIPV